MQKPKTASAATARTGAQQAMPKNDNSQTSTDAIKLLKDDHRRVEQLFASYENAGEDSSKKSELAQQVCRELIVHTMIEEELFYPACREKKVEDDLLDEAQVEHDTAKLLIGDLLTGSPDDDFFDAKMSVLTEYIKHHVAEEEKPRSGIMVKAKNAGVDMNALGARLQARKSELLAEGEGLTREPLQARSLLFDNINSSMKEDMMPRYSSERDDDRYYSSRGRSSRGNERERDDQGRFMSDDDDNRSYRSSGRGHGGWRGDSEGHSEAAERGWQQRSRGDSGRYEDDDDGRSSSRYSSRSRSSGGGRGHGGWFGDSEGHAEAAERGWQRGDHGPSGWYGDSEGHSEASRRGWQNSDHGRSGWYGDPEGHSEASERGWENRSRSRGRSSRDDDDDDYRASRSRSGSRGGSGWHGDPEGHSEASRRGWQRRD